jgi:hypothetical protein
MAVPCGYNLRCALCPPLDVELAKCVVPVVLDRAGADVELGGDLPVGFSL